MKKVKNYSKYFKISGLLLIIGLVSTYFYLNYTSSEFQIKKFDKVRDTQFILNWFEVDRYWLSNNPEFSPQFMIDHMSPKRDPEYFGKQNIVMLYVKGHPAGFGACYMKKFYEGWIHFLYIDKEFRGQGYSAQLVQNMIDLLVARGAKYIKLYTRFNNMPARTLYKKLGFKEFGPDEQNFMMFEMRVS